MRTAREAIPVALGAGGALLFVLGVLEPATRAEAAFAVCGLCLVVAACAGPFGDARRCAWLGLGAAVACFAAQPSLAAIACGLFCGLFAFALSAVARLLRAGALRVAVGIAGLALLATLHYWDGFQLLSAADRKASADLAFHLNPAAAASVTLGVDWLHAKALYTNNQTAESMFAVPLKGVGSYSVKLAVIAALALLAGLVRRK